MLKVIGVTFDNGVKSGRWELEGFYFQITAVDSALKKYRVVVTQPTRDGIGSASARDITLRLTERDVLEGIFRLTSQMHVQAQACADALEAFVRTELFGSRSGEETSIVDTRAN